MAAEAEQTFGQVAFLPKTVAAYTEVSRLLLLQSNADFVIARDLLRIIGTAIDKAALYGTGLNGQPIGLASLAGVASDLPEFITDTNKGVSSEVQVVVNSAGITDHRIWAIQGRLSLKMLNLPSADYTFSEKTYVDYFLSDRFAGRRFDPNDPALANFSPITHVRPGKTPFLHLYGMRDCAAPPIQGDLFHGRLKKAGVPSRLVLIPGAGHTMADVAGTGELMADFLAGHLVR